MKPLTRRKFLETGLKFLGCAGVTALMPTRVLDTLSKKEAEKQECLLPGETRYTTHGAYHDPGNDEIVFEVYNHFPGDHIKYEAINANGEKVVEKVIIPSSNRYSSSPSFLDSIYCPNGIDHSDPKRRCRK